MMLNAGIHLKEQEDTLWVYSRFSADVEPAESFSVPNSVYFQRNQFWSDFHACTLVHKRDTAQKADLHFAMQCKFLVGKSLYIFKSK